MAPGTMSTPAIMAPPVPAMTMAATIAAVRSAAGSSSGNGSRLATLRRRRVEKGSGSTPSSRA